MTSQHFDRAQPGWQMVAPGLYLDSEQQLHIFAHEILTANGYANTAANRKMVEEAISKQFGEIYPEVPVTHTSKEQP